MNARRPRTALRQLPLAALVTFCASATVASAGSLPPTRTDMFQGVSGALGCKAARASMEAGLRYRPLGVENEGTTPVFVTCAVPANARESFNDPGAEPIRTAQLSVGNGGAAASTVSCTYVHGFGTPNQTGAGLRYLSKAAALNPGSAALMFFQASEFPDLDGGLYYAQWSCLLPPGTGIYMLGYLYDHPV